MGSSRHQATHIVVAHCVHVVLQVTFPVVGQNDAAQLAVAGEVEARIGREHQQTGHIPPADLVLGTKQETLSLLTTIHCLCKKLIQKST